MLPSEPAFQAWTMDKIKAHLELSAVPIGDQYLTVSFPSFISDVVLIYGQVVNVTNPTEIYTAPCLIPSTCLQIRPVLPKIPNCCVYVYYFFTDILTKIQP